MSIRIYIGNLPQGFNPKEFDTLLKSVSDSIRYDREISTKYSTLSRHDRWPENGSE